MATQPKRPAPRALTDEEIELAFCAAVYSGPAGSHLFDAEDGEQMDVVIARAIEFRERFRAAHAH